MSAPPGYNPNETMLSGGNSAAIMKVMGGGGMAPPDGYNSSEMVISGGDSAQILRVMGGGGSTLSDFEIGQHLETMDPDEKEYIQVTNIQKEKEEGDGDLITGIRYKGDKTKVTINEKLLQSTVTGPPPPSAGKPLPLAGPPPPSAGTSALRVSLPSTTAGVSPPSSPVVIRARAALAELASAPAPSPAPAPAAPVPIRSGFQVEVYNPTIPASDDEAIAAFLEEIHMNITVTPLWRDHFTQLTKLFKEYSIKKWQRYLAADGTSQQSPILRKSQCDTYESSPPLTHKMVEILQRDGKDIIVIPSVDGDILFFLRALNFLYNNNCFEKVANEFFKLRSNFTVVCLAPFFSLENPETQKELLYIFLKFWYENRDNFVVLEENNTDSWKIGCQLYTGIPSEEESAKDYLMNMLNPSYLVLPTQVASFPGIIFSTGKTEKEASIPASKNSKYKSSGDIVGKAKTTALNIGDTADAKFSNYLTFISKGIPDSLPAPRLDIPICDNLQTIFYDEDIKKNLYKISEKSVYVIRIGQKRVAPIFCIEKSGKSRFLLPRPGAFQSNENHPDFDDSGPEKSIFFNGETLSIRIPVAGTRVRENWLNEIFSDDETVFLNLLNVTPMMLGKIFESEWKEDLAEFLQLVTVSDCFSDITLITKGECQKAYYFIEKIREWLFMNTVIDIEDDPLKQLAIPGSRTSSSAPRSTVRMEVPEEEELLEIHWPAEPNIRQIPKDMYKPTGNEINIRFDTDTEEWFQDVRVIYKNTFATAYYRIFLTNNNAKRVLRMKDTKTGKRIYQNISVYFIEQLRALEDKYKTDFKWIL